MKAQKIAALVTLTTILLSGCAGNAQSSNKEEAPISTAPNTTTEINAPIPAPGKVGSCICARMWMPVCGVNKVTYGNSCEAECAGVKYTMGECKKTK